MTNGDRIRAMTDKELAAFMTVSDCYGCPIQNEYGDENCSHDCDKEWLRWLKKEAKEDDND